jgi:RNA-directed DNA polymerase
VISPCLLNVALHGLEEAAGVRYGPDGIRIAKGSPVLVRYCDDFVACCHTRQQAEQVKTRLAGWLAPRGLAFNDEKTKIVSLEAGYDFLGFSIRRYRNGKLLIKPSKAAARRVKRKLAEQIRRLRGHNASAVLAAICPVTRGWASFYRSVVSKQTFTDVDDYLWKLTYKWACRSHPREAEALDHPTVLRPVQPLQARQLGLRRRGQRRLPAPDGLDSHHPAPQGHRPGLTRRPRPDRLLEPAARQEPAPA